jgi:hypothetical protein
MSIGVDRRIAFVPEPVPGEALTSWIRAVSDDLGCGMFQTAQIIGYRSAISARQLHSLMWNVEDAVLDRVGTITGLGHQGIRAMGFAGYAMVLGGAPRGSGRSALAWVRGAGLLYGSSKFCPCCLGESGGRWLLRWRFPWSFVCLEHQVFLQSGCPVDGQLAFSRELAPQHEVCTEPSSDGRQCGFRFADAASVTTTDQQVINTQQRIHELLDRATAAQADLDAEVSLVALLAASQVVRRAWAVRVREAARPVTDDSFLQARWTLLESGTANRVLFWDPTDAALACITADRLLAGVRGDLGAVVARIYGRGPEGAFSASDLALGYLHSPAAIDVALEPYRRRYGVRRSESTVSATEMR